MVNLQLISENFAEENGLLVLVVRPDHCRQLGVNSIRFDAAAFEIAVEAFKRMNNGVLYVEQWSWAMLNGRVLTAIRNNVLSGSAVRVVVIHEPEGLDVKANVSFYAMERGTLSELKTLKYPIDRELRYELGTTTHIPFGGRPKVLLGGENSNFLSRIRHAFTTFYKSRNPMHRKI